MPFNGMAKSMSSTDFLATLKKGKRFLIWGMVPPPLERSFLLSLVRVLRGDRFAFENFEQFKSGKYKTHSWFSWHAWYASTHLNILIIPIGAWLQLVVSVRGCWTALVVAEDVVQYCDDGDSSNAETHVFSESWKPSPVERCVLLLEVCWYRRWKLWRVGNTS